MNFTPEQLTGLNAAYTRQTQSSPDYTPIDKQNLDYATARGFSPTPPGDNLDVTVPSTDIGNTKPAENISPGPLEESPGTLKASSLSNFYNNQLDLMKPQYEAAQGNLSSITSQLGGLANAPGLGQQYQTQYGEQIAPVEQQMQGVNQQLTNLNTQLRSIEDDVRAQLGGRAAESIVKAEVARRAEPLVKQQQTLVDQYNALNSQRGQTLQGLQTQLGFQESDIQRQTQLLQMQQGLAQDTVSAFQTLAEKGMAATADEQQRATDLLFSFMESDPQFLQSLTPEEFTQMQQGVVPYSAIEKITLRTEAPDLKTVSEGQSLIDSTTGQVIFQAPKTTTGTANIQEYNLAKEQGYAGDFLDFVKEQKTSTAADPTSYREWQLAGSPGSYSDFLQQKNIKSATADQSKTAGFAMRVQESSNIIDDLEEYIDGMSTAEFFVQQKSPNFAKTSEQQMLEQAQRNFINAVLRRESGAAIADSEFESAEKQYFPQPGDSPEVKEQKRKNRETALNSLVISSGPALSDEFKDSVGKDIYKMVEDAGFDPADVDILLQQGMTRNQILELISNEPQKKNELGTLSEKYESGGNPGAIGYDSTGGLSYGAYQLAHKNALDFATKSPYANVFDGIEFNSKKWQDTWKKIAEIDPQGFKQAQKDYIEKTHFMPQVEKVQDSGFNIFDFSKPVLDVIWSTAVQHGPATNIITQALKTLGENASDESLIKKIYDLRWNGGKGFASSTKAVRDSVYNRFFGKGGELETALKQLK